MKSSVLYSIILLPIFIIFIVSISIFSVSYENINDIQEISAETIKDNFINNHKEISFNDINTLHNSILYDDDNITSVLQHELENKLGIAYDIVDNLYNIYKYELSLNEIREKVFTQLSFLTLDVKHEGYFYIFNTKSNTLLTNNQKQYSAHNLAYKDHATEISLMLTLKEGLKKDHFFFDSFSFSSTNLEQKESLKLFGVFEYKPLNIIVGTGEFLKFMENKYKNLYINKIESLNYKKDMNKIAIYDTSSSKVDNLLSNDKKISPELQKILILVRSGQNGFFKYNENGKDKLSYFTYIKKWDWIAESGFFVDRINSTLHKLEYDFKHKSSNITKNGIAFILLIILLTIALSSIIMNHLKNIITNYTTEINDYVKLVDKNIIISSTNLEGNITDVSEAFCKISGYTKEELLNKNHNIVRHENMPNSLYQTMWERITHNKTWHGELKNRRKDGSFYWVDATIYPVFKDKKKIGYTAIRQDITDKKRVEELSITDALTSLYNRRHFDTIFSKVLNTAKRTDEYFSFILLDIDLFKQYNDTYGHQKGDEALVKISHCINKQLKRATDMAFRLGGEEFGIIFKANNQEKAVLFAEKMRQAIEDLCIEHKKNEPSHYMTASIGLICEKANKLPSLEQIYHNTDTLLYSSKIKGRNQVSYKFTNQTSL